MFDKTDLSPFLYKGKTFGHFQKSKNDPSPNDLLKNIDNGTEISCATALSILLLILAGPVALLGFKISIRLEISEAVHVILDIELCVLNWNIGS